VQKKQKQNKKNTGKKQQYFPVVKKQKTLKKILAGGVRWRWDI